MLPPALVQVEVLLGGAAGTTIVAPFPAAAAGAGVVVIGEASGAAGVAEVGEPPEVEGGGEWRATSRWREHDRPGWSLRPSPAAGVFLLLLLNRICGPHT